MDFVDVLCRGMCKRPERQLPVWPACINAQLATCKCLHTLMPTNQQQNMQAPRDKFTLNFQQAGTPTEIPGSAVISACTHMSVRFLDTASHTDQLFVYGVWGKEGRSCDERTERQQLTNKTWQEIRRRQRASTFWLAVKAVWHFRHLQAGMMLIIIAMVEIVVEMWVWVDHAHQNRAHILIVRVRFSSQVQKEGMGLM